MPGRRGKGEESIVKCTYRPWAAHGTGLNARRHDRYGKPRSAGATSWVRIILVLLLGMAASACGSPNPPQGKGLVVGGIIPCAAIGPTSGVPYAAGTVTVLEGVMTWRSIGPGSFTAVFPNTEAAQQTVMTNSSYQFALAPGDYVFQAHFPPPANVSPYVSVMVRSGMTKHVDIPNMCK